MDTYQERTKMETKTENNHIMPIHGHIEAMSIKHTKSKDMTDRQKRTTLKEIPTKFGF